MTKEIPIIEVVKRCDLEHLKELILDPKVVNESDEHGWTALHWAAGKGDAQAVQLLIEHGGDIALTGKDERTPLMVAKAAGRREVVQILSAAEQVRGLWVDPATTQLYCKAYEVSHLRRFPQWSEIQGETIEGQAPLNDHDVVYLHQNFTVTRAMWPDQELVFTNATPEWKEFCQKTLQFSIPEDLL